MNSQQAWQSVIDHAKASETDWSRDPATDAQNWGIHHADPAPWNQLLGPVFPRGGPAGVVLREGAELVRWGDPTRADLTFSIAKTYLALLAGVAFDRGLLTDPDRPVHEDVPGIGFDSGNNARVSWRHLLQQTSEWSGECLGVPDQVDHFRRLSFEPAPPDGLTPPAKGSLRELAMPGAYWEYNDVRINQLSLALAHLFGEGVPDVFRKAIAKPLGLSDGWTWHGYDNSWVEIAGRRVQSVPGGSHWGGGIRISACDQALVGQLVLGQGTVDGQEIISSTWLQSMRMPCDIAPWYGYLLWLNTGHRLFPSAPEGASFAIGAGSSVVAHWPDEDVVIVTRWIHGDAVDGLMKTVREALAV